MMAADPDNEPVGQQQHASGGRDSIVAGGNVTINHGPGPGRGGAQARKIWGGIPARNLGFRGREDLLRAVADRRSSGEIETIARRAGLRTMSRDGMEKAFAGLTTLDEVAAAVHG